MSLFTASLNSGSNGNCYYIGTEKEAVLIDAGLSCRETEKRMANLNLSMQNVKAIFISHEHADHINGVVVLSRKYKLPVYITPLTIKRSSIFLEKNFIKSFTAGIPVKIGGLTINSFKKNHDAVEPHSFIVQGNGIKIGVLTDIGVSCEQVVYHFKQCHAAFLESNYDEQMLEQGSYPEYLKRRIKSDQGHLSNKQALELFINHKPEFMSHLFLSHLSEDNNNSELVYELFSKYAEKTNIVVASRYKETPVYQIGNTKMKLPEINDTVFRLQPLQMSLFE